MSILSDKAFEEILLLSAQAGDRAAADRLAARWQPRLLRTAYRYTQDRDLSLDVVQDAWIAICGGWTTLRDPSRFPAWAFRILRYKSADAIRRKQRWRARIDGAGEADSAGDDRQETLTSLDQAFTTLNPDLRLTAILFYGEGLNLAETALATGVPVGTVKSRLHTARGQMKAALKGDE